MTTDPTPDPTTTLAAWRAVTEGATRGPWAWDDHRVPTLSGRAGDPEVYAYDIEVIEADHRGECGCRSACELDLTVKPEDAAFIATARTAVPRLLSAVESALAVWAEHDDVARGRGHRENACVCLACQMARALAERLGGEGL